ncbi:MAG: chromate transporter [Alphaproteobacteria bacterium]
MHDPLPSAANPSPRELFLGFLSIGASGFGGVLPFARRMLVERKGWLTPAEFTEVLSLSQFLPGPNICNVSVCVGRRFHGMRGSLAAFGGLMLVPFCVVVALGLLYARYGHRQEVDAAFDGVAAAAAGLVVATGLKMLDNHRRDALALLFVGATFVGIAIFRWPLLILLLAVAPLSVLLVWWRRFRKVAP